MPNPADLMVQRIENTQADLIHFGSNQLSGTDVVTSIENQLSDMIESGHTIFVLDLRDVAHMSSQMLGSLITIHKYADLKGGGVHLLGPTPNVLTSLKISKLDELFSIHETLEDALACLSNS